jgi:hypothetical protein
MSRSRLDRADQRGDLTLGVTLLLLGLFVLLMALHPPVSAQPIAAQTPYDSDSSDTLIHQSPDARHIPKPYFHLRAGMGAEALDPPLPQG